MTGVKREAGAKASPLGPLLLGPNDEGYEDARKVWNAAVDRRPDVIARCTTVVDVLDALALARQRSLTVALKAGGHSYPGYAISEGGMVIDLSPMKGIRVDPKRRTAHAQPGLTWGDFDRETAVYGLATPGGVISTTGIAGLTLGGGIGWLTRKYGTSSDNLISVDVITADGRCITASVDENEDLFWAIRGGGGNFGIVTSFEYRLHPVREVFGGPILFPASEAKAVLEAYRELTANAPDELAAVALMRSAPPAPFVPEAFRGTPMIAVLAFHCGEAGEGEKLLEPLGRLGKPTANACRRRPYVEMQRLVDGGVPYGLCRDGRAHYVDKLTDDVIDTFVKSGSNRPTPETQVLVTNMLGGAATRVAHGATAFPLRKQAYSFEAIAQWKDPSAAAACRQWSSTVWNAMAPHATDAIYVNFLQDEAPAIVRVAYGDNYARLQQLKKKYDPGNLFRFNPNILAE